MVEKNRSYIGIFYMIYMEDFFQDILLYTIKNQWSFYLRKYSILLQSKLFHTITKPWQ